LSKEKNIVWIWLIGWGLLAWWLVSVLRGKGGLVHILLLCAVAVLVVQWIATRKEIED
jgi:hypothetical protein